jgi:DNA-binding transcriptional LysR family regulator
MRLLNSNDGSIKLANNLEQYKVFYHVARCGSLTVAAERLSISQPAVSQSVKQLENNLGVRLFVRAAKGVRLTSEGALLYDYVAAGYEQIVAGEQKLKQMLNLELGELRIGASDMTLLFYLLPFLESYHEKYPAVKVMISNGPTPETLTLLEQGKIDFGMVSNPFNAKQQVKAVEVREIEDIFVAGRKFMQYKNRMLDLQELSKLPLITLEQNTSTRSFIEAFLRNNEVIIRPEFEVANSEMIVQFALRNLGVGSVVKDFAMKYLDSGQLFELRFNKIIPRRQFCVVTHTGYPLSVAAGNFLAMLNRPSV